MLKVSSSDFRARGLRALPDWSLKLLWWLAIFLSPILFLQGLYVRRVTARLSASAGKPALPSQSPQSRFNGVARSRCRAPSLPATAADDGSRRQQQQRHDDQAPFGDGRDCRSRREHRVGPHDLR